MKGALLSSTAVVLTDPAPVFGLSFILSEPPRAKLAGLEIIGDLPAGVTGIWIDEFADIRRRLLEAHACEGSLS